MNNTTSEDFYAGLHPQSATGLSLIIIFSLLAVLCIVLNSLICYVILTRKTTSGPSKYYVFSLAITDILVGVACIPIFLSKEFTSHADWYTLESVSTGFDLFLGSCSIMHLCVMALDRTVAVTKSIFHRASFRLRKTVHIFLILPWWIGAVYCAVPFMQNSKNFEYESAMYIIYSIPCPCVFIIICYAIIFGSVRRRNANSKRDGLTSYRISQQRMTRTLLCMVIVFITCWVPIGTYHCLPRATFSSSNNVEHYVYYSAKFLSYFNSMCNPFIYALLNPVFRNGLRDIFKRCFGKKRIEQFSDSSQRNMRGTTIRNNFT